MLRIGLVPQGGKDWIAGAIVLQNLVRALALLPAEERPLLYLLPGRGQAVDALEGLGPIVPVKRYTFRVGDSLARKIKNTIRYAAFSHRPTSFERLAERLNLSALYPFQTSPGADFPRPWLGWIPDFQHKRLPQNFSRDELTQRDLRFRGIVEDAARVVVSSQDAYGDLMRWFPTDPERVGVLSFISVPASEWYLREPDDVVRAFAVPRRYLMFPSQFWIHKNHRCLFKAIGLLRESRCPDIALVCTGHMNDYRHLQYASELRADVRRQGLETNIYCLGLLDRSSQIQLMRGAVAIVQPSFFEGWSALLEDARLLGKRMYVSDIPVHREQNPPDAQFFDPESPEELADLIAKDWRHLPPGPDRAKEAQARAAQEPRAIAYARRFLAIADVSSQTC